MRNNFVQKSYTKYGAEASQLVLIPIVKNQKQAYLSFSRLKYYKVCFYGMSRSRSKYIKTAVLTTCRYLP